MFDIILYKMLRDTCRVKIIGIFFWLFMYMTWEGLKIASLHNSFCVHLIIKLSEILTTLTLLRMQKSNKTQIATSVWIVAMPTWNSDGDMENC